MIIFGILKLTCWFSFSGLVTLTFDRLTSKMDWPIQCFIRLPVLNKRPAICIKAFVIKWVKWPFDLKKHLQWPMSQVTFPPHLNFFPLLRYAQAPDRHRRTDGQMTDGVHLNRRMEQCQWPASEWQHPLTDNLYTSRYLHVTTGFSWRTINSPDSTRSLIYM